jgi:predicted membrane protein
VRDCCSSNVENFQKDICALEEFPGIVVLAVLTLVHTNFMHCLRRLYLFSRHIELKAQRVFYTAKYEPVYFPVSIVTEYGLDDLFTDRRRLVVLTAVTMNSSIFWDVKPCNVVQAYYYYYYYYWWGGTESLGICSSP